MEDGTYHVKTTRKKAEIDLSGIRISLVFNVADMKMSGYTRSKGNYNIYLW